MPLLNRRRVAALAIVLTWYFTVHRPRERRRAKRKIVVRHEASGSSHKFGSVVKAFKRNFLEGREVGAQLCCYYKGRKVVELTGGRTVQERLTRSSLVVIFSCTKVIESLVVAILADRGLIDYDAPVARYWPEFGKTVSPTATVSDLMGHKAGVSALSRPVTLANDLQLFHDGERMGEYLSSNTPEWVPESPPTRQIYHALTRGLYVAELVRRLDGRDINTFVQQEIVAKVPRSAEEAALGLKIDCSIGCQDHEHARVAKHVPTQSAPWVILRFVLHLLLPPHVLAKVYDPEMELLKPFELNLLKVLNDGPVRRAFTLFSDGPALPIHMANIPEIRSLPLASACGVSNARSLAAIGNQILSDSGSILSPEGLRSALLAGGKPLFDEGIGRRLAFSKCGWGLDRFAEFGCPGWIGWAGVGGSVFVLHPPTRSVFAYTVSGMAAEQYKARGVRILRAFDQAIKADRSFEQAQGKHS